MGDTRGFCPVKAVLPGSEAGGDRAETRIPPVPPGQCCPSVAAVGPNLPPPLRTLGIRRKTSSTASVPAGLGGAEPAAGSGEKLAVISLPRNSLQQV